MGDWLYVHTLQAMRISRGLLVFQCCVQALVETAMLAAVSGLAFLLSTLLKLDSSLGYFLPLPIVLAGCRSGAGAAWNTMISTAFLLLGEKEKRREDGWEGGERGRGATGRHG